MDKAVYLILTDQALDMHEKTIKVLTLFESLPAEIRLFEFFTVLEKLKARVHFNADDFDPHSSMTRL